MAFVVSSSLPVSARGVALAVTFMTLTGLPSCGNPSGGARDAASSFPGADALPGDAARSPDGGSAASAGDAAFSPDGGSAAPRLALELPASVPPGVAFPIIVRAADGTPLGGEVTVAIGARSPLIGTLYRGRGSVRATGASVGSLSVRVTRDDSSVERRIDVVVRPLRTVEGSLEGAGLRWDSSADVQITGTTTVPAGARLSVGPGARILFAANANLDVHGELVVDGTAEAPVLFAPRGAPWGGVHFHRGSRGQIRHALITGGGADLERAFGHSDSQPVVRVDEAEVTIEGGGVIDAPGKGPSSVKARLSLRDVLVSRVDTGGEHVDSHLEVQNSHFAEIPDGDGRLDDDDNDGLYVVSLEAPEATGHPVARITDSVFAVTEDDGVDHNGSVIEIERTWIERVPHEGVAGSTGGMVTVRDSVITRCHQGVEAGYGAPTLLVEKSLLWANDVALRWGDEYATENRGTLTARAVIVGASREADVINRWDGGGGIAKADGIRVSCSLVADATLVGRDGNLGGEPRFDERGCVTEPRALPGCPGPVGPLTCR